MGLERHEPQQNNQGKKSYIKKINGEMAICHSGNYRRTDCCFCVLESFLCLFCFVHFCRVHSPIGKAGVSRRKDYKKILLFGK